MMDWPPLSSMPESFTRFRAFPFGEPGEPTTFQRCLARPVRLPERFRGGCSFGVVITGGDADSPGRVLRHPERYTLEPKRSSIASVIVRQWS